MSQTASRFSFFWVFFGAIHVGANTSKEGHGDLTVVFCIDIFDGPP